MKEFLEFLLSKIVDSRKQSQVEYVEEADRILINITIPEGSHGQVIGRGGQTINAVRTLLRLFQIKHNLPEKLIALTIA